MKFHIINLDKDSHRLEFIKSQLDDQHLEYRVISAIEGGQLSNNDYSFFNNYTTMTLYPNEFACFLSHIKAWREFLKSSDQYAIVCEDDIVISKDTSAVISQIRMPESDLCVVRLETFLASTTLSLNSERVADRAVRRLYSNHGGAAGYMINRATAAYLIATAPQAAHAVDTELFDPKRGQFKDVVIRQVDPALCIQEQIRRPNSASFISNIKLRADIDAHARQNPVKKFLARFDAIKRFVRPLKNGLYTLVLLPTGKIRRIVQYR